MIRDRVPVIVQPKGYDIYVSESRLTVPMSIDVRPRMPKLKLGDNNQSAQ